MVTGKFTLISELNCHMISTFEKHVVYQTLPPKVNIVRYNDKTLQIFRILQLKDSKPWFAETIVTYFSVCMELIPSS